MDEQDEIEMQEERKQNDNQNTNSNSESSASSQLRANPLTVQWLMENFESTEGVSLPRSTIFAHYTRHCQECAIETMNPATFGKTIRGIFVGLRSRRLGTRGQSKYHYYGLSIKAHSPLNSVSTAQSSQSAEPLRVRASPSNRSRSSGRTPSMRSMPQVGGSGGSVFGDCPMVSPPPLSSINPAFPPKAHHSLDQVSLPQLLQSDVEWACFENQLNSSHVLLSIRDLRIFREMYRKHCLVVYENVAALKFSNIEHLWATFWRSRFDEDMETRLPLHCLHALVSCPSVQDMLVNVDVEFFATLIRVLIPDVLIPLPGTLTQLIRNFAKSMEGWVRESLTKMPRRFTHHRLLVASAVAQTFRRYTSLNHLTQAARTVLTNLAQTDTMLSDISRLDMSAIYEHGSLMCPCDLGAMKRFSDEFKQLLANPEASERWPSWIESVLDAVVGTQQQEDSAYLLLRWQQFCQQWSYFSSLAIRDLTLRSAASFGSFHLIRLLFDEYVVFAVEKRVAARAPTPTSPLRQFVQHLVDLYPFSDTLTAAPGRPSGTSTNPHSVSLASLSRSSSECSGAEIRL